MLNILNGYRGSERKTETEEAMGKYGPTVTLIQMFSPYLHTEATKYQTMFSNV